MWRFIIYTQDNQLFYKSNEYNSPNYASDLAMKQIKAFHIFGELSFKIVLS